MGLVTLGLLGEIELKVLCIHKEGFYSPSQGLQLKAALTNFLFDLEGANPQSLEVHVFAPVFMGPIQFKN